MNGKENRHTRHFRSGRLKAGETVEHHLEGWIGQMMGRGRETQRNGQLILTTLRVCFYRKGILGEVFETMPIAKITSIEHLSRIGYRVLRMHTSHDELAFKTFETKTAFDAFYERLEALRDDDGATVATDPRGAPMAAIADELSRLGEMKAQGLLTDDEFSQLKRKLLASM